MAPWAPLEEVKRAYRAKVARCHPDLHHVDERPHEEMLRLNRAREVLLAR